MSLNHTTCDISQMLFMYYSTLNNTDIKLRNFVNMSQKKGVELN